MTEFATHLRARRSGAAIDVFPRGNKDAFTRNLHFFIFFTILPLKLLVPSCLLFSSLTYSSCYSATTTAREDITVSLMKRHRCCCRLNFS